MGGGCAFDDQSVKEYNQLHVFDFATLSWMKPPLDTTNFPRRRGHMAVCHNDAMIVMGGKHDFGWLSCVKKTAHVLPSHQCHDSNLSLSRSVQCR